MKKILVKKKKGAALLSAILLSSIVGIIAIGTSAIAVRQINISETYSNGLIAFYSAESGLEEGLLRFRFDKNAEIPQAPTTEIPNLGRTPLKKYRSFLDRNPMISFTDLYSLYGTDGFYVLTDRQQVYDLQTYYKQNYYGEDMNNNGYIDSDDLLPIREQTNSHYRLAKDEQKDITITGNNNKIYLYWRWDKLCNSSPARNKRALEVKLKVDTALPEDRDEYTALFKDTTCNSVLANADEPKITDFQIFTPDVGETDLKTKMNILSLNVVSMSLKSIGGVNGDEIIFGFNQGSSQGGAKVAGPATTVKSIGYFAGVARETTAEIDRQNGTVLDLFNYVIYEGRD